MKTVKLSVLLSAYNAEKYIKEAIDSIINQSFQDFELIISDDGSDDRTKAIIDQFASNDHVVLSHNHSNKGKVETINRLLRIANGELITIHDADDWSSKDRFALQVDFLNDHQDYMMVGTSFYTVDMNGRLLSEDSMETSLESIRHNMGHKSQFHGPTIMFRKRVINEVGGLFRIMKMGEDIDFCMRLVEKYPATNLSDYLYYYRINPRSLTKSHNHDLREKYIDRHLIFFLASERSDGQPDSLTKGDFGVINKQRSVASKQFDHTLEEVIEEHVSYLLHYKLHMTAFKFVWVQMVRYGLSFKLFRILLYILKTKISD